MLLFLIMFSFVSPHLRDERERRWDFLFLFYSCRSLIRLCVFVRGFVRKLIMHPSTISSANEFIFCRFLAECVRCRGVVLETSFNARDSKLLS